MSHFIDLDDSSIKDLLNQGQENDKGNMEYKYKLTDLNDKQIEHFSTQMKYRINSDKEYGQAVYDIGLTDDGFAIGLNEAEMEESLKNIDIIAARAGAKICDIQRETNILHAKSEEDLLEKYLVTRRYQGMSGSMGSAEKKRQESRIEKTKDGMTEFTRHVARVLIRKCDECDFVSLRIGVAGNVDCGKSTTIGVLTKGVLDDGDGSARNAVANFKHEVDSGRTSSVAQQIMGFDNKGHSVNEMIRRKIRKPTWEDIVKNSTKVITFFDLAGHKKYLKTTISGITSNRPDYGMIMVGANMGITEITLEHINLCLYMKVPFMVLLTKIDLVEHAPNVLKETVDNVHQLIKKQTRKMPYRIRDVADVMSASKKIKSADIVPIFYVSNTTGQGLDLFKMFLNYLPIRRTYKTAVQKPCRMQVQEIFSVTGAGTVVAGLLIYGKVEVGDEVKIGPNVHGKFITSRIKSIQHMRVSKYELEAGNYACLALHNVPKKMISKCMFVLNGNSDAESIWEFSAKVHINTSNSINIKVGYQPVCHIGHIRQTCKILAIENIVFGKKTKELMQKKGINLKDVKSIGAGDEAKLRMRFCFRPELIFNEDRSKFVMRESRTQGVGVIEKTYDTTHQSMSNKDVTKGFKTRPSRRERRAVVAKTTPQ